MNKTTLTVTETDAGERLDKYLGGLDLGISRSAIQDMILSGEILVNGAIMNKKYQVNVDDVIEISVKKAVKLDSLPENIPLDIVFEDQHLIVVNKEKGMVVHPAAGNESGTLVNALLYHCDGNLSSINGVVRPGIVHRIDKDTSGLLVVAKDDKTHAGLSELFSTHDIERVYYAIAHGTPKEYTNTINKPIGRHPIDRKKMCVTLRGSRNAITHYEVIESLNGFSYLKLQLETGRTHQIRVHMSSIGHPLAGDTIYGAPGKGTNVQGQCLHAGVLGFVHPITGEKMHFEAPLPEYFQLLLEKLRGK